MDGAESIDTNPGLYPSLMDTCALPSLKYTAKTMQYGMNVSPVNPAGAPMAPRRDSNTPLGLMGLVTIIDGPPTATIPPPPRAEELGLQIPPAAVANRLNAPDEEPSTWEPQLVCRQAPPAPSDIVIIDTGGKGEEHKWRDANLAAQGVSLSP
ncbi:hypothetical protein GGTG_06453 [Gaeumannomyces tritici R3-111a-1]|uniref:Uncharacterized protein n=1 Tax=Gaeumannomyces tritici (strain R3-111a-1) TaxID=644352 RepID=J3NYV1_GAET3|nr:hypothetical protein GGTG_06453 [Gaeumannomyces tritici R3-111a-1]EJT76534.1 hypothetical protein GGTG_06453 [Gaeumannomyces tritici R3-111a-1]